MGKAISIKEEGKTIKHLDLFSGIGGFTIAAEWAGIETVAFCEINEWCIENALKRNWPYIPNLKDITKVDEEGVKYLGKIELITAGVPCQPASIIGKRKGVEDSRWLWPDTLRIIRALKPAWVVCENPTGLLTLDRGDRFAEILKRLQQAGYDVWWETIPASAVGGGHRRERVWIVAHLTDARLEGHTRVQRCWDKPERKSTQQARRSPQEGVFPTRHSEWWWKDQSPVPIVVDGVSSPAFWKEAVIATGNAIVPQVAYQILRNLN